MIYSWIMGLTPDFKMVWHSKWLQNQYETLKPFLPFLKLNNWVIPDIDFQHSSPFVNDLGHSKFYNDLGYSKIILNILE